jgi:NAD-reducing hydrogenase small subunit
MRKPVIATASLAGCFGCHMSILDIDERILDLVALVEFNKSPIDDLKTITKPVDIGIIEGGCCNSENVETLRAFRKSSKILISIGECAIMGGLPALRNGIPVRECLEEAYLDCPTVAADEAGLIPNDPELPILLDRVYPNHEIVKVDLFLPGCPPSAELIWTALTSLLQGKSLAFSYPLVKFD